jgi:two-component system OmpR family sensor kinase
MRTPLATGAGPAKALPSLRHELSRVVTAASLVWLLAVSAATALLVHHAVDELMDDGLQESAEVLYGLLVAQGDELPLRAPAEPVSPEDDKTLPAPPHSERLVWQVVKDEREVLLRSHQAPADHPLLAHFAPGFSDGEEHWRVYAMPLSRPGLVLYVAQWDLNRTRAVFQAIVGIGLGGLFVGLFCAGWLRSRATRALQPLRQLAGQVQAYELSSAHQTLAPASHVEFVEVHDAIVGLGDRLRERLEREQAFAAHAAHAMRTPLAAMDAQLAVAIEESPTPLRPRLVQVRRAATRLQGVIKGLLALFQSRDRLRPSRQSLADVIERLPLDNLPLDVLVSGHVDADPELLFAVLANLVENAARHGARTIWIEGLPEEGGLVSLAVEDDGQGVDAAGREALRQALTGDTRGERIGLGLRLASVVAEAHGGHLHLELPRHSAQGFRVRLSFQALGAPPVSAMP